MSNEKASPFPDGFVVPITGLLALLFAVMAGMTVLPALSGSASDMALPIIFGGASLLAFRLRQRAIAANEES
ncbi:hypothetical protein [Natronobacterium texcoconense]|uniref:PEP-CTERM protein-sorting domain-containing protein n=1 Tax=Natronobacterium texcoconense TaxID=1095778 RepID=A0A1H1B4A0_NATTX|nr:hypothetical protein [Natronobacterium texcoconense]SDQ46744.1 hypothetical protein SAMN04489842_0917 [Natronobacterium texcoconense]